MNVYDLFSEKEVISFSSLEFQEVTFGDIYDEEKITQ